MGEYPKKVQFLSCRSLLEAMMKRYGILDSHGNQVGPRYATLAEARAEYDRLRLTQDVYLVWFRGKSYTVLAH